MFVYEPIEQDLHVKESDMLHRVRAAMGGRLGKGRPGKGVGSIVVAGSLALVTAVSLVGCAPTASSEAGGKVTLTMWQQWGSGHERQVLDQLIANYEKLHPNITIKEVPVTNNAKILAAITGGTPPDIVDLGNSLPLGSWASSGAIVDLSSMIKASNLDTSKYIKSAYDGMKVGGKTYGLPFQVFLAGLLYNKQLLAEAGITQPPTTLEELAADAATLTKVDSSGKITQMGFLPTYPGPSEGQTCPLMTYGWAFGGEWFDASGKPTPASPQNVQALAWEKQFFDKFGVSKVQNFVQSSGSYLTAGDPFESGKLAMMFDGPWTPQYAKDNNPAIAKQLAVVPFPASASSPKSVGSTYIDANAQVIPAGSKHQQEAFDFIAWETSNAQEAATFSNAVANIPQLKDVPDFPLKSDPIFAEYIKIASTPQARSWTKTATSSTYGTNLCQAQDASVLTGVDPKAALEAVSTQ